MGVWRSGGGAGETGFYMEWVRLQEIGPAGIRVPVLGR